MKHFSCFTGIGGIDLAAEWAGFETVGQVELADYPYSKLCKHWPDVPKWRDVRDVTGGLIRELCDGSSPTLLSGGFPCQPFSYAGNRKGEEDDRFLWPEMLRLVSECRPSWFIGENVPGIITLALDQAITDLESIGYSVRAFDVPACAVGAFHTRRRIFIVGNANNGHVRTDEEICTGWNSLEFSNSHMADTNGSGCLHGQTQELSTERGFDAQRESFTGGADVSNSYEIRCDMRGFEGQGVHRREPSCNEVDPGSEIDRFRNYWSAEPGVCGVADGIPDRVDRIKCLGNAVVPQQIFPIINHIAQIENMA